VHDDVVPLATAAVSASLRGPVAPQTLRKESKLMPKNRPQQEEWPSFPSFASL